MDDITLCSPFVLNIDIISKAVAAVFRHMVNKIEMPPYLKFGVERETHRDSDDIIGLLQKL